MPSCTVFSVFAFYVKMIDEKPKPVSNTYNISIFLVPAITEEYTVCLYGEGSN